MKRVRVHVTRAQEKSSKVCRMILQNFSSSTLTSTIPQHVDVIISATADAVVVVSVSTFHCVVEFVRVGAQHRQELTKKPTITLRRGVV